MSRYTELYNELCGHPSDAMTPIRDYENDYFHRDDVKLPKARFSKCVQRHNGRGDSRRSNYTFKRPPSLHLELEGPLSKKQFSPINTERFTNIIKVEETPVGPEEFSDSEICRFFKAIKSLYVSETEYANLIDICNSIYKNGLHQNRVYRHRLLEPGSNDESLLFGNLETISSISKLFTTSLKRMILSEKEPGEIDDGFWERLATDDSLQRLTLSKCDIGELFNTNFLRIRSTYLSYCGSRRKQMDLFETMKTKNPYLFHRWYEHCYEASGKRRLEDLLGKPIKRLIEWSEYLETFVSLAPNVLEERFCTSVEKARGEYSSFSSYIEAETSEFNHNVMYDFSLTPIEIIQSYDSDEITDFKPHLGVLSMISENETSHNRESSQTLPVSRKDDVHGEPVHLRTTSGVSSIFSGTSSRYSGDTVAAQSVEPSQRQEIPQVADQACNDEPHSLADHIVVFKKLHRGLNHLKAALSKDDDMLSVIDVNLKHAKLWRQVIEFGKNNPSRDTAIAEQAILISSMSSAYVEKLERQREKATMMKLTLFESSVKRPLLTILNYCDSVRARLKELNSLKKDYITFLRQKTSHTHDLKKDILANHFQKMHRKMAQDLPRFIRLIHEALKYLTLSYHKVMLKYLEISAGGENCLIGDLEELGKLKRDVGKNYDILQMYSTARYCSKRLVRENWEFKQDLTCSKVLRRLFEL